MGPWQFRGGNAGKVSGGAPWASCCVLRGEICLVLVTQHESKGWAEDTGLLCTACSLGSSRTHVHLPLGFPPMWTSEVSPGQ